MKSFVIFVALIVATVLVAAANADCPYGDRTIKSGETIMVPCEKVTCETDGSISSLTCAEYRCPEGKLKGYTNPDPNANYPECCRQPICDD